jgi:hypothetical protein
MLWVAKIVVVIAVFGLAYYSAKTNITEQEVEGKKYNKTLSRSHRTNHI